ncbi:MAG: lptG [Burkholderiales bacterium]|nr:lptG [Burkholderiales bacterium]
MSIITRYIVKKCLFFTFLMSLATIIIITMFNILGQLGDVGKGSFTTTAMLFYATLLIPNYIYLLMPLAVLIGVMCGMLSLVNYSEYAIIRTSGVSLKKITIILFGFGFAFSLITFSFGELLGPEANHYAQVYKMEKMKQIVSTNLHSGIWSKDGTNAFVNIKQVMPDNTIVGVNIFVYDDNLKLKYFKTADEGKYDEKNRRWVLSHLKQYDYTKQDIVTTEINNFQWDTAIEPSYFNVLVIAPEDMSAISLLSYMHHLDINHQSTQRYQIAFWNKLLYPLACISMALIALAFTPNNRRNINLGVKLFAGILIGVAFFFTMRLIGFMALLFAWNAIIASLTPTLILFGFGWYFVIRKE